MAVKARTEFAIALKPKPAELAAVLDALAKGGVNLIGFCAYGHGDQARILLIPDNDDKARRALAGRRIKERSVVCVTTSSNKGSGASLAAKLESAGISVDYALASMSENGQDASVFNVYDAAAALGALK